MQLSSGCNCPQTCVHIMTISCCHRYSHIVGPRRGAYAKDPSMDYEVMSDQEWTPRSRAARTSGCACAQKFVSMLELLRRVFGLIICYIICKGLQLALMASHELEQP